MSATNAHAGSGTIMEYSVDLADQAAPPPLPMGPYPAEIVGVERRTSSSGNDYVRVLFRIHSDAYPADFVDGDPDGIVLMYNRVMLDDTPTARWRMRKFIEAIGGRLGRNVDFNEWLGLNAVIDIDEDEYEGEKRNQIRKVNPA